jgi:hypothetical protein
MSTSKCVVPVWSVHSVKYARQNFVYTDCTTFNGNYSVASRMTQPYRRVNVQTRHAQAPADWWVILQLPQNYDLLIIKVKLTLYQATLTYWLLAYDAVQFDNLIRMVISQHTFHSFPSFSKYKPYTIIKQCVPYHDVPIWNWRFMSVTTKILHSLKNNHKRSIRHKTNISRVLYDLLNPPHPQRSFQIVQLRRKMLQWDILLWFTKRPTKTQNHSQNITVHI